MKRKLIAFLIIAALCCGLMPTIAWAASSSEGDLDFIGLGSQYDDGIEIPVGESVSINLRNISSSFLPNEEYSFSVSDDSYIRLSNANQSGVRKGTTDLTVNGRAITDGTSATLTITLNGLDYNIDVEVTKRLDVSTGTSLTQLPNTSFTMNLRFELYDGRTRDNITSDMTYREDYDVYSNTPNIAEVIENANGTTWRIDTKAVGTAVIEVVATDPNGEAPQVTRTFSLTVSNSAGTTTTTPGSTTTTPTTPAAPPIEEQYSSTRFTAEVTVDGAKFHTSNDFSAGTAFAIRPENDGGDWWRSPAAFKGARGVYTANDEGIFELTYCDPEGKTFSFMVNTHKRIEKNKFMVPERVPVGALFAIKSPEGAGPGIWGKEGSFLSGSNGTYIPLKAGKTVLTFTTVKFRYTLYLDIIDESLPADGSPGTDAAPPTDTPAAETPPADVPAQPEAPPSGGLTLQSMIPRGSIVLH
jgi:hypothetical protein